MFIRTLFIVLLSAPAAIIAQEIDGPHESYYEVKIPTCNCSDEATQLDMNFCAKDCADAADSADSVMNELYSQIHESWTNDLNRYKAQGTEVDEDKIDRYEDMIHNLEETQDEFLDYRKEVLQIYDKMYEGGSIRPMIVNLERYEMAVSRIQTLMRLWETLEH